MLESQNSNEKTIKTPKNILEAYQHSLRLNILVALMVYRELGLSQIARLLKKSKSTISRHTRKLIELGLVDAHTKDKEVHSGNIKKKYYKLVKDSHDGAKEGLFPDLFKSVEKPEDISNTILDVCNAQKALFFLVQRITELSQTNYTHLAKEVSSCADNLDKLRYHLESFFYFMEEFPNLSVCFLSEKQFQQYTELKNDFDDKLNKLIEEIDDSVRPYLVIDMSIPIKKLLESEKRPL